MTFYKVVNTESLTISVEYIEHMSIKPFFENKNLCT